MNFKTYLQEMKEPEVLYLTEDEKIIHEFNVLQIAMALQNYDLIQEDLMTEGAWDKTKHVFTDFTSQFGRKDNLLKYLMQFTSNSAKMLLAAIKGDTERMKELKARFNREDFFELIYRLDSATLGLISGPIGLIEQITGWDIKGYLKKQLKSTKKHVLNIIDTFDELKKDLAMVFKPSKHPDVFNAVDNFKKTLKVKLNPIIKGNIRVSVNKKIRA